MKVDRHGKAAALTADQFAARTRRCRPRRSLTIVGDCCETTVAVQSHPGAAFFEVAASVDIRLIIPERRWFSRAVVVFVPVCGNDQWKMTVRPEAEKNQTHAFIR